MPMANPITDNAVNFVTSPGGAPAGGAGRQTPVGSMPPKSSMNVSHYVAAVVLVSTAILVTLHVLGFRFVASAGAGFSS